MINNRQGGRRRGRGGQRPQGISGGPGNRQDNRQRGNAAQLLEKYKGLARDAQLSGDRVQTEYFLQFADHYFRVLSESRVRFEEQRRQRGEDSEGDEDESDDLVEAEGEEVSERPQRRRGRDRDDRYERRERPERTGRGNGRADEDEDADERIAADVLPPAITADDAGDEPAAKPRRRTRRAPSDESGEDIAPAA